MTVASAIHPEAANKLALAVIASSSAPLLLLDGDCTILSASDPFCEAFLVDREAANGRPLAELGAGEWSLPQIDALLRATASGGAEIDAYETDLIRPNQPPRRLVLNAQKLDHGDTATVRLLLSVTDVTEARLADKLRDDMLRENGLLLQELQHRVANSLQIIASVLMQSARRVQSEEIRLHLHDAHSRVMSVAAIQKQLAGSGVGDVVLRPYFTDLCRSIGASMIRDHNQLALDVNADSSVVGADVSLSLGLIVTELVINALKHAFPNQENGKIKVGYRSEGLAWVLSVSDDGVGMPAAAEAAPAGLGTTIVEALAKKLGAKVVRSDADPGSTVSIVHD